MRLIIHGDTQPEWPLQLRTTYWDDYDSDEHPLFRNTLALPTVSDINYLTIN
ncbi:uncharacterized protein METZ01_LOCUS517106 [marine metagenome]|uniref:Uncharacterized protein n=1 Tax=marine metagenome TaxID=408172 RepID=A0A383F4Z6_9ZZZZ